MIPNLDENLGRILDTLKDEDLPLWEDLCLNFWKN